MSSDRGIPDSYESCISANTDVKERRMLRPRWCESPGRKRESQDHLDSLANHLFVVVSSCSVDIPIPSLGTHQLRPLAYATRLTLRASETVRYASSRFSSDGLPIQQLSRTVSEGYSKQDKRPLTRYRQTGYGYRCSSRCSRLSKRS